LLGGPCAIRGDCDGDVVSQAVKAQILAQEADEEEKFRQRMLQKFADDEKTEQMANDKRRMRVQAHKKAVEDLIVKRREERAAAKAAEVADINDAKERERLLRETIEKERQRILGEHAARLGLDFLPRGLLANQVRCCCTCVPLSALPLTSLACSPTCRCSRTLRRKEAALPGRRPAKRCTRSRVSNKLRWRESYTSYHVLRCHFQRAVDDEGEFTQKSQLKHG
jgi:hypothetical protein